MLKIKVGDTIKTKFGESAQVIDIFMDRTVSYEKMYALDKTIKIENSKEPYGNPNREKFRFRNDHIMYTSDLSTTVEKI